MGHYYSEMISETDEERQEREQRLEERRARCIARLQSATEEEGIFSVLCEIIADPQMSKIKYYL